jgi:hypothetical protein
MDILRRRGIRTLAKFLFILKESLDGWIADRILSTDLRVFGRYIPADDRTLADYIIRVCGPPTPEPKVDLPAQQTTKPPEQYNTKRPETPRQQPRNEERVIYFLPPKPTQIAEIPGQVEHLHHMFEGRRQQISDTLSILKQEEHAIKNILQKNVSEQRHLSKNQQAIHDISRRLQSIHHEAGQLLKPAPTDVIVRNRLDYLHDVPWNVTKTKH